MDLRRTSSTPKPRPFGSTSPSQPAAGRLNLVRKGPIAHPVDLSFKSVRLPLAALVSALAAFVALQVRAYRVAGAFEYPLDDPYIHLAMAEQIRRGGYGVNAGEFAAASSSPLFPFLLAPLTDTPFARFLPLGLNLVGLVLAAWVWGRILDQVGYREMTSGLVLSVVGPLALNFAGVAFTGMEHSLHLAATLAIVSGLITFLDERHVGRMLIAGVVLSPLLRFEGLALALAAAVVVLAGRSARAGAGLILAAVAPVGGFALWLMALGLEPLPSSVTAKLSTSDSGPAGYVTSKLLQLAGSSAAFAFVALVLVLAMSMRWTTAYRPLVLAVGAASGAHLVLGRFGWMNRYEIYILAALAATVAAVSVNVRISGRALAMTLLFAAFVYVPPQVLAYDDATFPVLLQHGEMTRFAHDHLAQPVAVNDLGKVAFQNPDYVVDLWGLANRDALRFRLDGATPGWANTVTDAHDAKVAMVYDDWFGDDLADEWQLLGQLSLKVDKGQVARDTVSFYLTDPDDAAPYVAMLEAWATDLPEHADFAFAVAADFDTSAPDQLAAVDEAN